MREIVEIELAIQGETEKTETLGTWLLHISPRMNVVANAMIASEQGKVDESMREIAVIEALKSEKSEKEVCVSIHTLILSSKFSLSQRELQLLVDISGASGHQKLRVCDVRGAYLSVLDFDRRLADHFGGKVKQPCPISIILLTSLLF
jgi:uncharacterized protein YfkK (UPF0435 family)